MTRTGDTTVTSTVDYTTTDGSATAADNDYVTTSGTLTFLTGETSHTISVPINGDVYFESDETFTVDLSNASAPTVIGDGQAIGTITNDDNAPGISVVDVSVPENGTASSFTVTMSPAVNGAVTVDYLLADGTARNGVNYVAAASGKLTFATGETSKTISFAVIDNTVADGNHTFNIQLSNSSGPAIVQANATGTIVDNEIKVVTVEGPPPAAPCTDTNFENPGMIRTHFTNDADRAGLSCRLLAANGSYLSWLGSPLTSSGNVGNSVVLNLGVIAAVDVFNPNNANGFVGDVNICLKGSGYMIYLNANTSPRVPQLWSTWTTPSFPGYTCTTLYAPGTVVLVQQKPQ